MMNHLSTRTAMPARYAEATNMVFPETACARDNLLMKDRFKTTRLIAEWQQRGPETLSGLAVRKLRLVVAPPQSVITASAAG
jgi:hypothetical protein